MAWLRVVVIALGIVVLLWGNNASTDRLWWSLALVLVLLAASRSWSAPAAVAARDLAGTTSRS